MFNSFRDFLIILSLCVYYDLYEPISTYSLHHPSQSVGVQCDQIWQNFGNLWPHFDPSLVIFMQFAKLSLMQMAKIQINNLAVWSHCCPPIFPLNIDSLTIDRCPKAWSFVEIFGAQSFREGPRLLLHRSTWKIKQFFTRPSITNHAKVQICLGKLFFYYY